MTERVGGGTRSTAPSSAAGGQPGDASLWAYVLELVLLVDASSGRITTASGSWTSYGVSSGDLVGQPLLTVVHPDDRPAFEPYLLRPELAHAEPVLQVRVAVDDGWMPAVARLRPAPTGDAIALAVLPLQDAMARTLQAEVQAASRLQAIDDMKQRLVEATSHELRTPLTVIAGFGETLQRDDAEFGREDLRRIGESIQRHAGRLERIVADLVDLDQKSRPSPATDIGPCDLGDVVRAVVDRVQVGDRRVHLSTQRVVANVDPDRFGRVVECLLDNARRHTPEGTEILVELTATDGRAVLCVSDDGPGLDDDVSAELFSAFAQGGRDPGSPGLGLGLAIVRRFADRHGGRCWHARRAGGGARFFVEVPTDPVTADRHAEGGPGDPWETPRQEPDAAVTDVVRSVLATAQREVGMRVAYLSRLSADTQTVLETYGDGRAMGIVPGDRRPIEETYCARVVSGELDNAVLDTRDHPATVDLPATRAGCRAYIGVPVHLPSGHVFGTLCCVDDEAATHLAGHELPTLRALARVLGDELGRQQVSVEEQRELTSRVETLLRRRDGLRVLFQPIVDLRSGVVAGVEALSRFPDGELRPPDLWFADAARVGLSGQLEQTAVHRAIGELDHLPTDRYLSLNLSPDAIASGGLRPLLGRVDLDRIVIEITEHASITDYDRVTTLLQPFRDGGARLAIDDVGAGFANLRHVLQMHPEVIKLDRSLVANVAADPAQRAIAGALSDVADRLGASIVAEGIEDTATLDALRLAGVTHGQGWLFGRASALPLPTLRYDRLAPPDGASAAPRLLQHDRDGGGHARGRSWRGDSNP